MFCCLCHSWHTVLSFGGRSPSFIVSQIADWYEMVSFHFAYASGAPFFVLLSPIIAHVCIRWLPALYAGMSGEFLFTRETNSDEPITSVHENGVEVIGLKADLGFDQRPI